MGGKIGVFFRKGKKFSGVFTLREQFLFFELAILFLATRASIWRLQKIEKGNFSESEKVGFQIFQEDCSASFNLVSSKTLLWKLVVQQQTSFFFRNFKKENKNNK